MPGMRIPTQPLKLLGQRSCLVCDVSKPVVVIGRKGSLHSPIGGSSGIEGCFEPRHRSFIGRRNVSELQELLDLLIGCDSRLIHPRYSPKLGSAAIDLLSETITY